MTSNKLPIKKSAKFERNTGTGITVCENFTRSANSEWKPSGSSQTLSLNSVEVVNTELRPEFNTWRLPFRTTSGNRVQYCKIFKLTETTIHGLKVLWETCGNLSR